MKKPLSFDECLAAYDRAKTDQEITTLQQDATRLSTDPFKAGCLEEARHSARVRVAQT